MTQTLQQQQHPFASPQSLGYASNASTWTPPAGVTEHSGQPIPPDAEFFLPPPAEIGPVRSARTTLRLRNQPWAMWLRLAVAIGITVAGSGIIWACYLMSGNSASRSLAAIDPMILLLPPLLIGVVILPVTLFATRFSHFCTYVGQYGAARSTLRGSRGNRPGGEVFLFPQAAELRTRQVRRYVNGVYTGTSYNFTWTDPNGRRVYRLSGNHRGGKSLPKPKDPYHFALATELSWSQYLLAHLASQLEQAGFVHFNIKPGQWVRVGPGFFDFCLNQEVQRITTPEIKSLNLAGGHFHIAHKDARWFSRRGKFSFDYPNMANARLFLLAVEKLIGYRFA